MAGRSRSTFGKQQKEQKRQEKRRDKSARKEQRKQEKQSGVPGEENQFDDLDLGAPLEFPKDHFPQ